MEPVIATEYTGAARRQEVLPPGAKGGSEKNTERWVRTLGGEDSSMLRGDYN